MTPLPSICRQLVCALAAEWNAPHTRVLRFERWPDGGWHTVGEIMPAMLGRAGLAWGRGLHRDAEAGARGPVGIESLLEQPCLPAIRTGRDRTSRSGSPVAPTRFS